MLSPLKTTVIFLLCGAAILPAAEITVEQAKTAAGNWRLRSTEPLGTTLGQTVDNAETYYDSTRAPVFHVVKFSGGGFAVLSADTGVRPVIAFSSGDALEADEQNPLWALLTGDLPERMSAARAAQTAVQTFSTHATAAQILPEDEWTQLLTPSRMRSAALPDDVRVAPLIQSKWGQDNWRDRYRLYTTNVFNYYTPSNYVCGCVATMTAQIMRYHQFPATGIPAGSYTCVVNDISLNLTMQGGVYDWGSMPLVPVGTLSETQQKAIGKLTSDIGISLRAQYTANGTGAFAFLVADEIVSRFQYANAQKLVSSSGLTGYIDSAVLANLDAKLPVGLGIQGNAGHAVVADGYGYKNGIRYVHLNMGWNGTDDVWYNIPEISAGGHTFDVLTTIIYNIFPTNTGEIISGRILDQNGIPAAGATAFVKKGSTVISTTSDSNGIYAVIAPAPATYQITATTANGWTGSKTVTVSKSVQANTTYNDATGEGWSSSTGSSGNQWGINISAATPPPATQNSPVSVPYVWLETNGLAAAGSPPAVYETAAMNDKDGDGMKAWEEYVAGTDPNDASDYFRVSFAPFQPNAAVITWSPAYTSRNYIVEGRATLTNPWETVAATNATHSFFRVKVKLP
ncbi:MAG: C10 family peptidase [Kiritimatiellales bacterium]